MQRNINCDTHCVLCDETWESSNHLFPHCPFVILIWQSMLRKLCLQLIPVPSPIQMIKTIIHRLDQKSDIQLLGELIFPTVVWNVWHERNGRIFQQTNLNVATVQRRIQYHVRSRIVHLGIQLPDDIGSRWDLPVDRPIKKPLVVISLPNNWPITIAKLSP